MKKDYPYKYFKGRANIYKEIEPEVLDEYFENIIEYFGEEWLDQRSNHPLCLLWKRKDFLATNELFNLGYSLKRLKGINEPWLVKTGRLAKSDKPINSNGAFFEIFGIASLMSDDYKLVIPPVNQKGYDATLEFGDIKSAKISIKNFGVSVYHNVLMYRASRIEEQIVKFLNDNNLTLYQVIIVTEDINLVAADWNLLEEEVVNILSHCIESKKISTPNKLGKWKILIEELGYPPDKVFKGKSSYSILIIAPYYDNEEKNVISKIEDACNDFKKTNIREDESNINILFAHISQNINLVNLEDWSRNFLENNPEKPISAIILYQPTVVNTPNNYISHCFRYVVTEKYLKWSNLGGKTQLHFSVGVGQTFTEPTTVAFIIKDEAFKFENHYIYQSGNHYLLAEEEIDEETGGTNQSFTPFKVASGIVAHGVFKAGDGSFTISQHFPPKDELLIV